MKKVLLVILVLMVTQFAFGGHYAGETPYPGYPAPATIANEIIDDPETEYEYSGREEYWSVGGINPYTITVYTVMSGPYTGKKFYHVYSVSQPLVLATLAEAEILFDAWFEKYMIKDSSSTESGDMGSTPVNPIVSQNIQTFKLNVFSERVQPRAAKKEDKKDGEGKSQQSSLRLLRPNQGGADLSNEFFSIDKADGNNFSARGGYSKTIEHSLGGFTGALSFGGNMIYNYIKFKDADKGFANMTINLFANKNLTETTEKVRNAGILYNYLGIDNDMSDDDGYAIGFHYSEKLYMGENLLTYGGIYNFAGMGDYSTSYLSLGGMYGMPVGELMAANFELFYTRILLASYDGKSVTIDSKNSMNLGASMSYMVSDAFSLNGGARTTLLVKDYSSFEIYLGSSYWF